LQLCQREEEAALSAPTQWSTNHARRVTHSWSATAR
jgi:hypothetical protein